MNSNVVRYFFIEIVAFIIKLLSGYLPLVELY